MQGQTKEVSMRRVTLSEYMLVDRLIKEPDAWSDESTMTGPSSRKPVGERQHSSKLRDR
jgi:hypothetical protein